MKTTQNTATSFIFTVQPEDIRPALTERQINNRMKKISDLDAEIKRLQALRDSVADEVKEAMTTDCIETDAFKITYKDVTTNRFDSKAFRAEYPDVYKEYCKTSTCKRFTYTVK